MKKFLVISIFAIILAAASFTGYLLVADKIFFRVPLLVQQTPVVTYFTGDVQYRQSEGSPWLKAMVGTRLGKGYEIKTGKKSIADIRFHANTAVRVASESSFEISSLSVKELKIKIENGSLYGKFERLYQNHIMELITKTTVAAIRGTELGIETSGPTDEGAGKGPDAKAETSVKSEAPEELTDAGLSTTVYSLSGIISVYNPNFFEDTVLLSNQNKLTVAGDSPPSNPKKMSEDDIEKIQAILNSIHEEEVLFITDKIYFAVGSARILAASNPELDTIAGLLKKGDEKVRIEGHTDTDGMAHMNQVLSEKRAESIRQFLIKKGIDEKRLSIAGFGESRPIAPNKAKEDRAKNRRVEFIIVE